MWKKTFFRGCLLFVLAASLIWFGCNSDPESNPKAPPGAPTGVTATAGAGKVTVSWTAVANAAAYQAGWRTAGATTAWTEVAVPSGTTIEITLANGTYDFVVRAKFADSAWGVWSEVKTATVGGGTSPGVPAGVTATAHIGYVTVSWTAVTNATAYQAGWRMTGATAWTEEAVPSGISVDITLEDGTYEFAVRARFADSEWGVWSEAVTATVSNTPPVFALSVTASALNELTVAWDAEEEASGFDVKWNTTDNESGATPLTGPITGKTATITSASPFTVHYVWVQARYAGGGSEWTQGSGMSSGNPGTVSISGNIWLGATLAVDTAGLATGGTGSLEYQWTSAGTDITNATNGTYTIQTADHGKAVGVKVRKADWPEITEAAVSDNTITPVRGWMIKTIASNESVASAVNIPGTITLTEGLRGARTTAVDSNGFVYTHAMNDSSTAQIIWKLDSEDTFTNADGKATPLIFARSAGERANDSRYIAVDPSDDSLYAVRGNSRDMYKFPNSFTTNDGGNATGFEEIFPASLINDPSTGIPNWGTVYGTDGTTVLDTPNPNQVIEGELAVAEDGTIYSIDSYHYRVLKIVPDTTAVITVLAGASIEDDLLGTGTDARFKTLSGITIGHDGAVYVADGYSDGAIKRIDTVTGEVTLAFGEGWGNPFVSMGGLAYNKDTKAYYLIDRVGGGDDWGAVIQKITPVGGDWDNYEPGDHGTYEVTIIAGNPNQKGEADGQALTEALFAGGRIGNRGLGTRGISVYYDSVAGKEKIYLVDGWTADGAGSVIRMIYWDND